MNEEDLIIAYCTACDTVQAHKPEKANHYEMVKHLATTDPYFPTAVNLAWLLASCKDFFEKEDYEYYVWVLANALHRAHARG